MSTPSFVLFASPDGTSPPIGRSDKEDLEAAVKSSYLDKFPGTLDPVWFSTGISAIKKRSSDGYAEFDMQIPDLGTCHPRLSSVVPIAEGLFCSSASTGCSYSRQVTLSKSYSTTAGLKVGATVSVGGTYWHDTTIPDGFAVFMDGLLLEYSKNRHEPAAPYGFPAVWGNVGSGLQYCRYQTMAQEMFDPPAYRAELWKSLISDEDTTRGKAYIGNAADLNAFRVKDQQDPSLNKEFEADELVFSRLMGMAELAAKQPKVLRCKPARPKAKSGKMLVPLKGPGGIIQGYIGCI
ncbi:hypothetical protein DL98DRAFT_572187 [Cadophora sp. DSE1049]|nr:hypothetical protein DL98DRAFT_572187 [Cadophora sp. DSE1049]